MTGQTFWSLVLWCAAFVAAALVAYAFGRFRGRKRPRRARGRQDIARALVVAEDLEAIATRLHSSLARHLPAVSRFRRKVDRMERGLEGSWQDFYDRADELLKPTMRLGTEVSHAYAEVLRQMDELASLLELRADPLTRISNRRAFDESLAGLLRDQFRHPVTFSLALIDIDNFKRINDQQGHLQGDRLLQTLTELLKANVRECDQLSRFGGEAFAILMPHTELHAACSLGERMRTAVAERLPVTVSVGLAASQNGDDADALISRASRALQAAKAAGRNRVYLHDANSDQLVGIRTSSTSDDDQAVDIVVGPECEEALAQ